MDLKQKIIDDLNPVIASWTDKDIYAISFYVNDDEGNWYYPTLEVGYNTLSNYNDCLEDCEDQEEKAEAKWNYAYWLQNQEYILGFEKTDNAIRDWAKAEGSAEVDEPFVFDNEDASDCEEFVFDEEKFMEGALKAAEEFEENLAKIFEGQGDALGDYKEFEDNYSDNEETTQGCLTQSEVTTAFYKVLVEVVKELHNSGILKRKFGKEVPIIIHELEYYDKIAKINIAANGKDLAEDFVQFVKGV